VPPPPQWGNKYGQRGKFTYYLNKARNRSKLKSDIDEPYLQELWNLQDGKCAYSGISMECSQGWIKSTERPVMNMASLDRIDSSIGYMKGNVQFICVPFNLAKNDRSDAEFRSFLESVITSMKSV